MYAVGEEVWAVISPAEEVRVPCPDCCGKGFLLVTFGDGTVVSTDCQTCMVGYMPASPGYLTVWINTVGAEKVVVNGVRVEGGLVEYSATAGSGQGYTYNLPEDHVFSSKDKALEKSSELRTAKHVAVVENLRKRHDPSKRWSWNASYHRRCLRELRDKIEYHESKLRVAADQAKKEKDT